MNEKEISEKLNQILAYLNERKEYLFNQIQQLKQNLENLTEEIRKQEKYMELEFHKEQRESNIFNLYDTTNKFVEERKLLAGKLAGMNVEKEQFETLLITWQKEFDRLNETIISNQILIRYSAKQHSQQKKDAKTLHNAEETNTKEENIKNEMIDRLKFCIGILELDKERCLMELQNLVSELE